MTSNTERVFAEVHDTSIRAGAAYRTWPADWTRAASGSANRTRAAAGPADWAGAAARPGTAEGSETAAEADQTWTGSKGSEETASQIIGASIFQGPMLQ